jgi:hypothetical protein
MEGRHEGLEPLDRAYDLSSLSGEVEAVGRGDRSMQQCRASPLGKGGERQQPDQGGQHLDGVDGHRMQHLHHPGRPEGGQPVVALSLAGPTPCWIIQPPTPWATSKMSRPVRIARVMLGGACMAVNASIVRAKITVTVTAIAVPPSRNSRVSRAVSK